MRLHLGCGEKYLEGYVNIDFPLEAHSIQKTTKADLCADLLSLRYPPGSIEEIRLHHVFEHFTRPVACALLAGWHRWLVPGGLLHLEVPDLEMTAKKINSRFVPMARKLVGIRHLFGSHEAGWAAHYEGYTAGTLRHLLRHFGFVAGTVSFNEWRGTYNVEMLASREKGPEVGGDPEERARSYLRQYLLDESEESLLDVWMVAWHRQYERMTDGGKQ